MKQKILIWIFAFFILVSIAFAETINFSIKKTPFEEEYLFRLKNTFPDKMLVNLNGEFKFYDAKICEFNGQNCTLTKEIETNETKLLVVRALIPHRNVNLTNETLYLVSDQINIQFDVNYHEENKDGILAGISRSLSISEDSIKYGIILLVLLIAFKTWK